MIPDELPKDIFDHAYDKDDVPCPQELSRLKLIATKHIPLRRNSKLLVDEAKRLAKGKRGTDRDFPESSDEDRGRGRRVKVEPAHRACRRVSVTEEPRSDSEPEDKGLPTSLQQRNRNLLASLRPRVSASYSAANVPETKPKAEDTESGDDKQHLSEAPPEETPIRGAPSIYVKIEPTTAAIPKPSTAPKYEAPILKAEAAAASAAPAPAKVAVPALSKEEQKEGEGHEKA